MDTHVEKLHELRQWFPTFFVVVPPKQKCYLRGYPIRKTYHKCFFLVIW